MKSLFPSIFSPMPRVDDAQYSSADQCLEEKTSPHSNMARIDPLRSAILSEAQHPCEVLHAAEILRMRSGGQRALVLNVLALLPRPKAR